MCNSFSVIDSSQMVDYLLKLTFYAMSQSLYIIDDIAVLLVRFVAYVAPHYLE